MSELASFPATFAAPQTRADWIAANPLLDLFQFGQESDGSKGIKVGPGYWNDLPYIANSGTKIYRVYLNRTGSNAPSPTVDTDTIGSPTWSRESSGNYLLTKTDAFPVGKTFFICDKAFPQGEDLASVNLVRITQDSASVVRMIVGQESAVGDVDLDSYQFTVLVYP